jgi:hypothetical protein
MQQAGIHAAHYKSLYERGLIIFGFIKKTTSYGIEILYLLYIFPPELHTLMASLF